MSIFSIRIELINSSYVYIVGFDKGLIGRDWIWQKYANYGLPNEKECPGDPMPYEFHLHVQKSKEAFERTIETYWGWVQNRKINRIAVSTLTRNYPPPCGSQTSLTSNLPRNVHSAVILREIPNMSINSVYYQAHIDGIYGVITVVASYLLLLWSLFFSTQSTRWINSYMISCLRLNQQTLPIPTLFLYYISTWSFPRIW